MPDFCEAEKVGCEGVVAPVADVVFEVAGGRLVGNGGGGDGLAGVEGDLEEGRLEGEDR